MIIRAVGNMISRKCPFATLNLGKNFGEKVTIMSSKVKAVLEENGEFVQSHETSDSTVTSKNAGDSKIKSIVDGLKSFVNKPNDGTADQIKSEEQVYTFDNLREALINFKTQKDYFDFYEKNSKLLSYDLNVLLLFFDYYSEFLELKTIESSSKKPFNLPPILSHSEDSDEILSSILKIVSNKLSEYSLDPFLTLSFFESLQKIKDASNISLSSNEVYIILQYLVLRTNFLKQIKTRHYPVILKNLEFLFTNPKAVVDAEEIYERIEYEVILEIKRLHSNCVSEINESGNSKGKKGYLANTKLTEYLHKNPELLVELNLIEIFYYFAKNSEGSTEFYEIMAPLLTANLEDYLTSDIKTLVQVYYSIVLVMNTVCKTKNLENLAKYIEKAIEAETNNADNKDFENALLQEHTFLRDMLKWALNNRNKTSLENRI